MRYSLKVPRLMKYFFVLGNSIFLHFRSVSNKLKKMAEFWYRIFFRHDNEVFVEISNSCAIFLCFGQLDFPSFSVRFE
ncbi:hypothetical protein T07_11414 [Trichinella nelsoni]|uniref:Uncharacterized protein n=1 Tax=Trichinella nelsoni TaxID=6336 RepID=A0A0V0SN85_9BILA|nr:hypothetical protein T07_11414 [Trichinella nelsoni]